MEFYPGALRNLLAEAWAWLEAQGLLAYNDPWRVLKSHC
jgi:hypothetical protein